MRATATTPAMRRWPGEKIARLVFEVIAPDSSGPALPGTSSFRQPVSSGVAVTGGTLSAVLSGGIADAWGQGFRIGSGLPVSGGVRCAARETP
jgi:hypothetical protein